MEKGHGRDRLSAVTLGENPAGRPVPFDLVGMDISPAFHAGRVLTVAGIEEVEDPVEAFLPGKGQDVVGAAADAEIVRGVDISGDRPEDLVHLSP